MLEKATLSPDRRQGKSCSPRRIRISHDSPVEKQFIYSIFTMKVIMSSDNYHYFKNIRRSFNHQISLIAE